MGKDRIIKRTVHSIPSGSLLPTVIENKNNDKAVTAYYNVKPDIRAS